MEKILLLFITSNQKRAGVMFLLRPMKKKPFATVVLFFSLRCTNEKKAGVVLCHAAAVTCIF